jgi:hypothetical protein
VTDPEEAENSPCSGRDLNPVSPKYETRVLLTRTRYSVPLISAGGDRNEGGGLFTFTKPSNASQRS